MLIYYVQADWREREWLGREVPAMHIFERTKKKTGQWVSQACADMAVIHYPFYTRILCTLVYSNSPNLNTLTGCIPAEYRVAYSDVTTEQPAISPAAEPGVADSAGGRNKRCAVLG